MKVVIRNATILCRDSPFHKTTKDIFISNGIISDISDQVETDADVEIKEDGLHVSIGWMDIFAQFCEPGLEHRETLVSGAAAASQGGFTHVMALPNTSPAISSKSQVVFVKEKSAGLPVTFYPIGAITKNAEGNELSEMYDMLEEGALAFSDGLSPLQDPAVLVKALQYLLAADATLIQLPDTKSLSGNTLMHEGIISTRMGLPGNPAVAEELMIERDISLLRYTKSKLHLTGVSTKKGIELVRKAKEEGLNLTCSVTPFHLFFCDEDLTGYDTNLKVNPPLRTKEDRDALRKGLDDGTIDCIASHHIPQHADNKECEFEYANPGMITLQNVFGIASRYTDTERLVELMTANPRRIFNIPMPAMEAGAPACLTLFNPEETYIFKREMIKSISFNSPFADVEMQGRVIGTIHKNQLNLNQ